MSYHEVGYVEYLEREAASLLDEVKRLQAELEDCNGKALRWSRAAAAFERDAVDSRYAAELAKSESRAARGRVAVLAADVERLQAENAFFRGRLEIISVKMDGEHVWRFSSGWPPFVGPNVDEVMRRVVEALQSGPATTKNDCLP